MGRQEWIDSLKVDRRVIVQALMNDEGGLGVNREQKKKRKDQVDEELSVLQARDDPHLDFLEGNSWYPKPHWKRFYYQTKVNQALVQAPEDGNREQRSGVLFFLTQPNGFPSPTALALLLSQRIKNHTHNNGPNQSLSSYNQALDASEQIEDEGTRKIPTKRDEKRCICSLLACYLDEEWDRDRPLGLWPYPYFKRPDLFKEREAVTIHFMIRYAKLFVVENATNALWPQTLRRIPSFQRGKRNAKRKAMSIVEQRHLLYMKYFPRDSKAHKNVEPPYNFTLISLGPLRHNDIHEVVLGVQEAEAKKTGDLAPIILFIRYLRRFFLFYTEEWDDVLARIDEEISFKLSDVEDYSKGSQTDAMMHDDASQKTSIAYFQLFHVLRILDSMVKETLDDFRNWHSKVVSTMEGESHTFKNDHLDGAVKEWKKWGERLEARLGGIRRRIADERADVQSLSDNMFNATSIKEARESTDLNRLVLVFTVVTVVYTPLAFVTALFGMNTIQDGSVLFSSWVPFGYTLTIVCLTTYLVTFISVWWLGWTEFGERFRKCLKGSTGNKRIENNLGHKTNVASTGHREQANEEVGWRDVANADFNR